MQNKNSERLVIVQNPNSTRANKINKKVFGPLNEHDISYEIYHTVSPDTEENIVDMQENIPDGARVITGAGDGTAMQLVNASVRGNKDWTLGFMPLGNFNDHARSRANRHHTVLDLVSNDTPVIHNRPLTVEVDGEYWRHAPAYVTLGWTALAASQFGDSESRQAMKDAPAALKLAKSLGQLAGNYFENRKTSLPAFEANGVYHDNSTDILAVNSPRVGSIVRSQATYYDTSYFGARTDIDVSRILPNIPFGLQAISGHTPLERVNSMRIIFDEVSKVPIQTEGEFQWLDAKEIFIYKRPEDIVRVLHPKSSSRR